MDTIPLEMDDIFGEYENDDDDGVFNPAALPDLVDELEPMRDARQDSNQEENGDDGEVDPELLGQLKNMKGASKNTTKRSLPKLDATRLTGERGIAVLPKTFERVRLKGKNHEAQDLKVIMHTLQHWGHRLFPKMTFDEVLERVERLGAKKEVQTCLKRIRLDMPVLASDFVGDDEDNVQRAGDSTMADAAEDNHDDSIRSEAHNRSHDEISDNELEDLLREQAQPLNTQVDPPRSQSQKPAGDKNSGLSEEVRKRIEENKRKALEKRAARMAGNTSTSNSPTVKLSTGSNDKLLVGETDTNKSTSATDLTCEEHRPASDSGPPCESTRTDEMEGVQQTIDEDLPNPRESLIEKDLSENVEAPVSSTEEVNHPENVKGGTVPFVPRCDVDNELLESDQ